MESMSAADRLQKVTAITDRLANNMAKQQQCLKELVLWEQVIAQGFVADEVEAFTFHDEFLGFEDRRRRRQALAARRPDPFTDGTHIKFFNAVRKKDGTLHKLEPMIERV